MKNFPCNDWLHNKLIRSFALNYDSNGAISQGFVCKCKSSFTGRRCQRRRNECHPNPCQNRGKCVLGNSKSGNYFMEFSFYRNFGPNLISYWMNDLIQMDFYHFQENNEKITSGFHCECKSGFGGILCQNGKSDEGKRYRKR